MNSQFRMALCLDHLRRLGVETEPGNHHLVVSLRRADQLLYLKRRYRSILRPETHGHGIGSVQVATLPDTFGMNNASCLVLEEGFEPSELLALISDECNPVCTEMLRHAREIGVNIVDFDLCYFLLYFSR